MAKEKNIEDIPVYRTLQEMSKDELVELVEYFQGLDGMVGLFYANNKKFNELAKSLNSFKLDVASGGKEFSNYLSLQKEMRDMFETQEWLKTKLGLTDNDIKNETPRNLPPLEQKIK
jgi:hypothetical protein